MCRFSVCLPFGLIVCVFFWLSQTYILLSAFLLSHNRLLVMKPNPKRLNGQNVFGLVEIKLFKIVCTYDIVCQFFWEIIKNVYVKVYMIAYLYNDHKVRSETSKQISLGLTNLCRPYLWVVPKHSHSESTVVCLVKWCHFSTKLSKQDILRIVVNRSNLLKVIASSNQTDRRT